MLTPDGQFSGVICIICSPFVSFGVIRQKKYDEALPINERALKIMEEALGQDHPSVATGLNNRALLFMAQVRRSHVSALLYSLVCK